MASVPTIGRHVMRRFKLIRLKDRMEASTWGSVSVAVNNTKMTFVSADFAAINSLVNSYLLDFDKKPNKFITCAFRHKLLPSNNSNSSNIHKINTTNSHAGDGNETKAFGY